MGRRASGDITYARDALNGQLPEPLAARVEERVFVESPSAPPDTQ